MSGADLLLVIVGISSTAMAAKGLLAAGGIWPWIGYVLILLLLYWLLSTRIGTDLSQEIIRLPGQVEQGIAGLQFGGGGQ